MVMSQAPSDSGALRAAAEARPDRGRRGAWPGGTGDAAGDLDRTPGICTIHTPDPQPAMVRGLIFSPSAQLVVAHIDRIDGRRHIERIEEMTATGGAGAAGDHFTTNILFMWERSGWKKGYLVEGEWGGDRGRAM